MRQSGVGGEGGGKVVVITGASAGVGRAVAQAFAEQGASIGLLARGRDGLEGAKRDVEARGGRGLVLPTDVSDADAVEAAVTAQRALAVEPGFAKVATAADAIAYGDVA